MELPTSADSEPSSAERREAYVSGSEQTEDLMGEQRMFIASIVLGARDPRALARFYQQLLGWRTVDDRPDWVKLVAPDGEPSLSFQSEPHHTPPVWPGTPDNQQMMMHLDIAVKSLDDAVATATDLGARLADFQPQDDVRVLIDPAGHPFCLFERADMGERNGES